MFRVLSIVHACLSFVIMSLYESFSHRYSFFLPLRGYILPLYLYIDNLPYIRNAIPHLFTQLVIIPCPFLDGRLRQFGRLAVWLKHSSLSSPPSQAVSRSYHVRAFSSRWNELSCVLELECATALHPQHPLCPHSLTTSLQITLILRFKAPHDTFSKNITIFAYGYEFLLEKLIFFQKRYYFNSLLRLILSVLIVG